VARISVLSFLLGYWKKTMFEIKTKNFGQASGNFQADPRILGGKIDYYLP